MSDINTNLANQLTENINKVFPSLSDPAGYSAGLNDTLNAIRNNFSILANHDFVKGESGDSVKIREVDLTIEDEFGIKQPTAFGQLLLNAISSKYSDDELADIECTDGTVLKWTDKFYEQSGKLYVIYDSTAVTIDTDIAYSSLYYTFIDGRYANSKIGLIDPKKYEDKPDVSCIAIYDKNENNQEGGFKLLSNAFPTIYYEENIGLCWNINGTETNIPVQGIPGKNGTNATMYIVAANISETNELGKTSNGPVTNVFEAYYGYRPVSEISNLEVYNNAPALILGNTLEDNTNNFYFGILSIETIDNVPVLYAHCSPATSITNSINTEAFINAMKKIDIMGTADDASSTPRGLFIPLSEKTIEYKQPVHLLSATSITNEEGSINNLKTDIVFTPIDDYNTIDIDEHSNKNIIVEKYLYLKLDKNNNITGGSLPYDGVLKYKLSSIIKSVDSSNFDVYNPNNTNTTGSRSFGIINNTQLNDNNTYYIDSIDESKILSNPDSYDYITEVSEHYKSMPIEFRKRIDDTYRENNNIDSKLSHSIYRWDLCNTSHNWDVDELISQSVDSYDFDTRFKTIYTYELTPGPNSSFLWFNGYELYNESKKPVKNNKFIIKGWSNGENDPILSFIKFVPIYINDFNITDDTTLNLNYNVNITGDSNNPQKSITINGNVNCDNLNVYKLTATGAIQNIYTEDKIIGTRGISLCNNQNDDSKFDFIVEEDGEVIAQSGVRTKFVNCTPLVYIDEQTGYESVINSEDYSVISEHVKTDDIITKKIDISPNNSSNANITIGKSNATQDIDNTVELGITINNVNDINISASEYSYSEDNKNNVNVPVITTDLPVNMTGNGNIIVSNQPKGSTELYFKDIKKDLIDSTSKYTGDGVNVDNIDFESARNFNLHRLYANSSGGGNETVTTYGIGQSANTISGNRYKYITFTESSKDVSVLEAPASNVNTQYISNGYLQKYSISNTQNGKYNGLDSSKPIKITFNKDFMFHIGINGKCDNGRWPVLWNTSKLTLSLWIVPSISDPIDLGISETYNIDYTTNNSKNDNGYGWSGFDDNGNTIGNYKYHWRYYTYKFRPNSFTISGNALKKVIDKLSTEETLTLYVIATANLKAVGQNTAKVLGIGGNPKEVIKGLWMSCPRPINETKLTAGTSTKKQNTGTKINFTPASSETDKVSTLELSYKLNTDNSNTDVKTTTICNDGIVMRSGKYTFGLGSATGVNHNKFENNTCVGYNMSYGLWPNNIFNERPVLFYYDSSIIAQYPSDSNVSTTNAGYARRVNSIPLDELFFTIKYLRDSQNFMFGI